MTADALLPRPQRPLPARPRDRPRPRAASRCRALGPRRALLGARRRPRRGAARDGNPTSPIPWASPRAWTRTAQYIDALAALGFGFLEVGTVTPRPQPGNAKPRLFRLVEHEAIINRMGFNNVGVEQLVRERGAARASAASSASTSARTSTRRSSAPPTTTSRASTRCTTRATYVAVNISSPNTKNLRDLQSSEKLDELLARAHGAPRTRSPPRTGRAKPLAREGRAGPRRRRRSRRSRSSR